MPIHQLNLDRRHELAEFLRNRRARLLPEQVGLPRGTRRHTPGLRRGEGAWLAGVSLEWYTWLEQGRDINVSVHVLESLVRALQLDANERTHLFLLALRQPPLLQHNGCKCAFESIRGLASLLIWMYYSRIYYSFQ